MNSLEDLRVFLKKKFEEKAITQNALANLLGVDQGSLSRFAKGETGIAGETAFKIMKYFNIQVTTPNNLPVMHRVGAHSPEMLVEGNDLVSVPVMSVAGAGPGQFGYELEPVSNINILQEFIHPELFVCKIEGDSMEPTIMPGAYVGAIPPTKLREGGIYIFYDETLGAMAKRLRYKGPGQLVLESDNQFAAPIPIDARGYERIIVGEVLWVWHQFKR